jgi:DNA-binding XRE family transcriptional regulator
MDLANRIKEVRQIRFMSSAGLAKKVGVTRAAVYCWEAGRNEPRPDVLLRVAQALCVDKEYLESGRGGAPVPATSVNQILEVARLQLAHAMDLPKDRIELELRVRGAEAWPSEGV